MLILPLAATILAATEYARLENPYANDDDIVWANNPKQWHQQMARTVSHRFQSFDEFKSFARAAKQAGISSLMLVGVNKIASCPGPWYGGLQLCDHIKKITCMQSLGLKAHAHTA